MRKGGQDTGRSISREKKEKFRAVLLAELEVYRNRGIPLYLEGEPSSPGAIAKACQIAEGGGYMRDYTEDDRGRIARVDFDFIEDEEFTKE